MRSLRSIMWALFGACVVQTPVFAAVLYVSGDRQGGPADGRSWATAYSSIQDGVNAAQPGDQVWVAISTRNYSDPVIIATPNVALYGGFRSGDISLDQRVPSPIYGPVISGGAAGPLVTVLPSATGVVIDGFQITDSRGGPGLLIGASSVVITHNWVTYCENVSGFGGGISCTGDLCVLVDNNIRGNEAGGGGGIFISGRNVLVARNNVAYNTASSNADRLMDGGALGGGVLVGSGSATLKDNLVTSNLAIAYTTYSVGTSGNAAVGGGIAVRYADANLLNNTVADNIATGMGGGGGGGLYLSGGGVTLGNNIVYRNASLPLNGNGIIIGGGVRTTPLPGQPAASVTLRNNLLYANAPDDGVPTGDWGNRHLDPDFFNGTYHPAPGSPAIDTGDLTYVSAEDLDFGGRSRVLGPNVDIGAVEAIVPSVPGSLARVCVRPDGDDRRSGAFWATAKRSIDAALSVAAPGAQVWVAGGTYAGLVTISQSVALYGGFRGTETDLSQRNPRANGTVLDANGLGATVTILEAARGTRIDGFVIQRGGIGASSAMPADGGGGILSRAPGVVIANNTITNNVAAAGGYYPVAGGGGISAYGDGLQIVNNVIAHNRAAASFTGALFPAAGGAAYGGGINVGGANVTVANNLIVNNQVLGYGQVPLVVNGSAISASITSGRIISNTIADNSATMNTYTVQGVLGSAVELTRPSAAVVVANNVLAFNTGRFYQHLGAAAFSHNDVFGNGSGGGDDGGVGTNGSIAADPQFLDRYNGDYRLLSTSPCIDAGDYSAAAGPTDLDGRARIQGARIDMGAYEFTVSGAFSAKDLASALRVAAGLTPASPIFLSRLDLVDPTGHRIDLLDAVRIARKVAGLEANP